MHTSMPARIHVCRLPFHYTASLCLTLLHYNKYIPLHYVSLRYTTLHCTTLHYTTCRYITCQYMNCLFITLHYMPCHYLTYMITQTQTHRHACSRTCFHSSVPDCRPWGLRQLRDVLVLPGRHHRAAGFEDRSDLRSDVSACHRRGSMQPHEPRPSGA